MGVVGSFSGGWRCGGGQRREIGQGLNEMVFCGGGVVSGSIGRQRWPRRRERSE